VIPAGLFCFKSQKQEKRGVHSPLNKILKPQPPMILMIILQIGRNGSHGEGSTPAKDKVAIVPTQTAALTRRKEYFCIRPPSH
jgi:hypothetical protein